MKKFLKTTLLTTGLLVGIVPVLSAADAAAPATTPAPTQHHRVGPLRRMMIGHHIAKQLGLSNDQIAQMKAARKAAAANLKAIRADSSLTPDQKREKVRQTLASTRQQMRSVLTAEQQAKLQQLRQERRQARQAKGV